MKKLYLVFLALVLLFIPATYSVAVYQLDQPVSRLNGYTLREVFENSNEIINFDFSDGSTGFFIFSAIGSVANDTYSFTATAQFGHITQSLSVINTNKYYVASRYKATSELVRISRSGNLTPSFISHSGSGNYELVSGIFTATATGTANLQISDWRVSGWTQIDVDYIYFIDLTSLGISHLTVEQMDKYFDLYLEAVRFEIENVDASGDPGGYQNIFKSVINGVKGLIVEMGNVWQFLNAPIITSEMSDYSFSIDWSWDLIGVVRQLINSLAILILQTNFIFINLLFSFTGIPVQISILSMIFSNFVFVILGWIIVKSFII